MRSRLDDGDELQVDMAPLIDCVFLLLIFFRVVATRKKIDKELPLDLPDAKASLEVQQPDDFAVISVDSDGVLYLDGSPIAIGMLQEQLTTRVASNPELKIRMDVDRRAEFAKVMEVLDYLRQYDITNIGINTRKTDG